MESRMEREIWGELRVRKEEEYLKEKKEEELE